MRRTPIEHDQRACLNLGRDLAIFRPGRVIKRFRDQFAIGLAIVTKSAAGLIALIITAAFCLFSGRLKQIFARSWKQILLVLASSMAVALAYFLPVSLMQEGAFGEYFTENIYGRILKGYHNIDC